MKLRSSRFQLTVIVTAVLARRCGRTARSATPYWPFIDVLIALFTAYHHDAKLQKTGQCGKF